MIKTQTLRYFVTVVKAGTLSQAAQELGRTPSAVSMRIKQLEDFIKAPLFENERKSTLTELGKRVFEVANQHVDHFHDTIEAIERYALFVNGLVRVASVPSAAVTFLPPAIRALQQAHPYISIDISDLSSYAVCRQVHMGNVDFGIVSHLDSQVEQTLQVKHLVKDRYGIVCQADHPLTQHKQPWDALAEHPFIDNGLTRGLIGEALRQAKDHSRLFIHNTTSLIAFVQAGQGVTVLPELACRSLPKPLRFIPHARFSRDVSLITSHNRKLSTAAQLLYERLYEGGIKFQKN
ncbi:MAG: LysR family transcriptional regulator [Pseudomonadota bacterium]